VVIAHLELHIVVLQIFFIFWEAGLSSRENSKVEYTYGWYSASARTQCYAWYNDKDNAVVRLNAEKHLYMTLKLLSPIQYVKATGWNYPLSLIKYTTHRDPQGDSIDHTAS
jgi:hypothetical protein